MQKELKLNEIPEFTKNFLEKIESFDNKATVIGLYGNLGAGKTTFTKEIAKQLGIEKEITSPTFTLQSSYDVEGSKFNKLVHIDLYRIESIDEVKILRLEELFKTPKTLVLIEWADKLEDSRLRGNDRTRGSDRVHRNDRTRGSDRVHRNDRTCEDDKVRGNDKKHRDDGGEEKIPAGACPRLRSGTGMTGGAGMTSGVIKIKIEHKDEDSRLIEIAW